MADKDKKAKQSDNESKHGDKKTFVTGEDDHHKEPHHELTEEQKEKMEEERLRREEEERAEAERIRIEEEKARKRQEQAIQFEEYVEQSGLKYAFQIIFTEIISKQIKEDQVFAYTAMRLRQIGTELDNLEKVAEK